MPAEWTSVRLRRATLERLREMQKLLQEVQYRGRLETAGGTDQVTLDDVVNHCLDRVEQHQERAREQHRRRRVKGAEAP